MHRHLKKVEKATEWIPRASGEKCNIPIDSLMLIMQLLKFLSPEL